MTAALARTYRAAPPLVLGTARWRIYRVGAVGQSYTRADLDDMVAALPRQGFNPPLTLNYKAGEHGDTGPAYGWITELWREADTLCATVADMPEPIARWLQAGRFTEQAIAVYENLQRGPRVFRRALCRLNLVSTDPDVLRFASQRRYSERSAAMRPTFNYSTDGMSAEGLTVQQAGAILDEAARQRMRGDPKLNYVEALRTVRGDPEYREVTRVYAGVPPRTIDRSYSDEGDPAAAAHKAGEELHRRIREFRLAHPAVTYGEAMRIELDKDPALKMQYARA